MPDKTIDLGRLVIRAFDVKTVRWGDEMSVTPQGEMTVSKAMLPELTEEMDTIRSIDLRLIQPNEHDQWTNTILDIIPISTKALGVVGEGITHTLTGVCAMITAVDTEGKQCHEFGSSEGNLKEQLVLDHPGTPGSSDVIISFDVLLEAGMGQERKGAFQAHLACDKFLQVYREQMKGFDGRLCSEKHEFHNIARPGKKRVVIIREIAGQGAMYDMQLFPHEPSGVEGGRSIIDMGNMPVLVTPNEYRDGILHSMQ
jgi:D-proline reductase (dithiol) PrdD